MSKKPKVSVIITTKNSEIDLVELLKSLINQSYKNFETIVVDNNSTDHTTAVARKFANFVYNIGPERSTQRNFGAGKAKGQYLLFLDSDMVLTKNVIISLVKKVTEINDLGAVVIPEKSFGRNYWAKVKAFERELNEGEEYFEAARFFPRKIFEQFGGYDETITGPEDWDLPERIKKKYLVERINEYILHNEGNLSLIKLIKKKYYYALSLNTYLQKNNISIFGKKTIYLLRPGFYKNWRKMLANPRQTMGLFVLLSLESAAGLCGYIIGKNKA